MRAIWLLIILIAIAVGFLFFSEKQLNIDALFKDTKLSDIPKILTDKISVSEEKKDSVTTVYKWQDHSGAWHYGDNPPANVNAIPITVNAAQNSIPAYAPIPEKEEKSQERDNEETISPNTQELKQQQKEAEEAMPSALPDSYQQLQKMLDVTITPQQEK